MSPFHAVLRSLHGPVYRYRLQRLVELIAPALLPGDRVLDAGCGCGLLGHELMRHVQGVYVEGAERSPRGGEWIRVTQCMPHQLPWKDGSFDVVILADVLHHDAASGELLAECARVSRRLLIVKDHVRQDFLAQARISLLDWAANAGYDVPCLYRYKTLNEWQDTLRPFAAETMTEKTSVDIYPFALNYTLGGRLHYFTVIRLQKAPATEAAHCDELSRV